MEKSGFKFAEFLRLRPLQNIENFVVYIDQKVYL